MNVTINGQAREAPDGGTIADVLAALGVADGRVAVEVNRQLIPRAKHAETQLSEGDRIEVVTLVGGG